RIDGRYMLAMNGDRAAADGNVPDRRAVLAHARRSGFLLLLISPEVAVRTGNRQRRGFVETSFRIVNPKHIGEFRFLCPRHHPRRLAIDAHRQDRKWFVTAARLEDADL